MTGLAAHGDRVTLLPFLPTAAFQRLYDPRQWLRTTLSLVAGVARRIAQLPMICTADAVFVQREAMLLGPPVVEWLTARVARRPMVLDLDDATYLDQAPSIYGRLSRALKAHGKTDRLIDWSSMVICGNESIAAHVRGRGRPAVVMPTIVDTSVFVPRSRVPGPDELPVIGWVGSHSTTDYFKAIVPMLESLAQEFRFRVRIVGAREPVVIEGVEVECLPWRRDREVFDFQSLDIGVYPLPRDVWAEAKSGLKAIEYLSVGVPFVASPVGVVARIGIPGQTHFLAESPDEWREALARLLEERELRLGMGKAGRAHAVEHYSLEKAAVLLDEVLQTSSGRAMRPARNMDSSVVSGFGDEWSRFDQTPVSRSEMSDLFDGYFRIFPWEILPAGAMGLDIGCGSGRWAALVAPRVGKLLCVDASKQAVEVARRNLSTHPNCEVAMASVDELPVPDASADFAYSLGVLHHIPDTAAGVRSCAAKLKPGAPFLLYLYYALDNRPRWFRFLWHLSNPLRLVISQLPHGLRYILSQVLAGVVYWPLARLARRLERWGLNVSSMPLSYYRERSFYVMRNDVLDRFGTRLERRFTREQVEVLMRDAGFDEIRFSETAPFWCAVGIRR